MILSGLREEGGGREKENKKKGHKKKKRERQDAGRADLTGDETRTRGKSAVVRPCLPTFSVSSSPPARGCMWCVCVLQAAAQTDGTAQENEPHSFSAPPCRLIPKKREMHAGLCVFCPSRLSPGRISGQSWDGAGNVAPFHSPGAPW